MKKDDRERWLQTLEVVVARRPDEAEAEWAWVMKELGLGPDYFLAVYEAVRQGRWREAQDPRSYLKTVAKREARGNIRPHARARLAGSKLEQDQERELRRVRQNRADYGAEITVGFEGPDGGGDGCESAEDRLDYLEYRQDSGRPVQENDGVWRSGAGWGALHERGMIKPKLRRRPTENGRPLVVDPSQIKPLDPYYQNYVGPEPERPPDWEKMAAAAGLSDWERKVVHYMMSGMGWRKACEAETDEKSRRALIAAWRSMERTGLKRLQEGMKKSFPQDVAKEGYSDTE